MIIYLYGPDSYRRQEKFNEIISSYKKKNENFSLYYFDLGEDGGFGKLADFLKEQSLFGGSKMAVVSGSDLLEKSEQKNYIKLLKSNLETQGITILISESGKPTKDFNFLIKEPVIFQEFKNLEGADLQRFILREAKKRIIVIDGESREFLGRIYKDNNWGLVTELDKLSLLDEKNINKKIIEKHLHAFLPLQFFGAINELRGGNMAERLAALEEFLSRSQEPAMIFNMIAVSPYGSPAWKQKMADYDVAIKSGKLEYEEVLTNMTIE